MLRIRLRRTGKKKQPQYRLIVADQRAPRDGAFVEIVGHYNPRSNPKELVVKEERIKYWLSVGAQPSETVHRLLYKEGLIEKEPRKRPTKPSKVEREAAAAVATAEAEAAAAAEAEAKASAEAKAAAEASSDDAAASSDDTDKEEAE
ncbi:MAG: 30S ribosomal protein S16 [Dehalococcoidia bacterium]